MKRSSTMNLALVWAAAASVIGVGVASVPAFSHHGTAPAAATQALSVRPTVTPSATATPTPSATKAVVKVTAKVPAKAQATAAARVTQAAAKATTRATATQAATRTTTRTSTRTTTTRPTTKPAPAPKPAPSGDYIQIGSWVRQIAVAHGSQAAINNCGPAVVWYGPLPGEGSGMTWLAGHNYCGFAFWANLSIGTKVTIHDAAGTFVYRVVMRTTLAQQGGTAAGILHDDLLLQTCTNTGTGLTYADLVSHTA